MSFVKKTINDYTVATESGLAMADSAGANVVHAYSSTINEDLSNKKFAVQVEVTEVSGGDGAWDVTLQGSLDGTAWVDLDVDLIDDIDPTGLNTGAGLADTTSMYTPYYRFDVHTDGTDTLDAAAFTLMYAII